MTMPASGFAVPDERAGSSWLVREGSARQAELLVGLLSRFNHDLRTPLNTVVGWTHLLQQGLVDSARSKHVADVLARNTREQTVLLDEFVDDGRALLGVLKLDPVPLKADEVVAQALQRAAPVITLHGVTLNPRVDVGDAEVEGDERRLQRLFYRLFVAAVRRGREGATVELGITADDDRVVMRIDTPAADGDWTDAALLDLRISSFVSAMHQGELAMDGTPGRASIELRIPRRR